MSSPRRLAQATLGIILPELREYDDTNYSTQLDAAFSHKIFIDLQSKYYIIIITNDPYIFYHIVFVYVQVLCSYILFRISFL